MALGGLLVRHRGLLAVIVTCGLLAVYPASVTTSRTIFLEPWLTLFCLAGALAVFDGDQLAGRVAAVAAMTRDAFDHAQYVWLAGMYNSRRIAWTPELRAYFSRNFVKVLFDNKGDTLYVRKH